MRELILKAHVWLGATLVPMLDRVVSFKGMLRLVTPPGWLRPYRALPADRIAEVVRHRLRRPRHMRRRACLREGLTLFHFLSLAGLPAVLHVAVYPPGGDAGRLRGHCWVTCGGRDVSAPPQEPFALVLRHCGRSHAPAGAPPSS